MSRVEFEPQSGDKVKDKPDQSQWTSATSSTTAIPLLMGYFGDGGLFGVNPTLFDLIKWKTSENSQLCSWNSGLLDFFFFPKKASVKVYNNLLSCSQLFICYLLINGSLLKNHQKVLIWTDLPFSREDQLGPLHILLLSLSSSLQGPFCPSGSELNLRSISFFVLLDPPPLILRCGVYNKAVGEFFCCVDVDVESESAAAEQNRAELTPAWPRTLEKSHFSLSVTQVQKGEVRGISLISCMTVCTPIHTGSCLYTLILLR